MEKEKKKKKEGEEKRETATQHATETLFFPSISFMKLVLESVEKRDFLETSLWEGREVWALEMHALLLINTE